ncbi:MAG: hypothetical protein U0R80_16320 [Nocardioidaceae bacterium]
MPKAGRVAKAAATGAKLAVKYGPQAKIVWDKGGKQASQAAAKRALSLNARRKALAHASGVIDGAILKIAPQGTTVYVVFTGDQPIATYPEQSTSFAVLLQHADLDKRVRPEDARLSRRMPRPPKPRTRPRELH